MAESKTVVDEKTNDQSSAKAKDTKKVKTPEGVKAPRGVKKFLAPKEYRADDWKTVSSVNFNDGCIVEQVKNVPPDRKGCLIRNVTVSISGITVSASEFVPGVTVQKIKNEDGYALNGGSR